MPYTNHLFYINFSTNATIIIDVIFTYVSLFKLLTFIVVAVLKKNKIFINSSQPSASFPGMIDKMQ